MLLSDKITEIYYILDEFFMNFDEIVSAHTLNQNNDLKQRNRKFNLSQSEVMTIFVLFHYGSFKNLKHFYVFYVQKKFKT